MKKKESSLIDHLHNEDISVIRAIQGTNPCFSTHKLEYTENCQRCVAAYEARRRGYDVIAKPILLSSCDPLPYMLSSEGWPAVYKDHKLECCEADTSEQARQKVEALMKKYGNSSRAIVKVNWRMTRKGHLFMAENRNDVIYFVDPQTGELDVAWYFDYANPHSVVVMRTDKTDFTNLAVHCMTNLKVGK